MHSSEVDYVILGDNSSPLEVPNPPPTEVDQKVARLIAAEIEDGPVCKSASAVCPMPYAASWKEVA